MDLDVAYHSVFSKIVLFQALAILPLSLLKIPLPPAKVIQGFPSPSGLPNARAKIIEVPMSPTSRDLAFLLTIYILDVIFLYPYTKEGRLLLEETNSTIISLFFWAGSGALVLQFLAACAWSGIQTDWIAAERRHGLWHFTPWKIYYCSFILTGLGIGLPMLFKLGWTIILLAIEVLPIVCNIFSHQFAPIKAWW
jgi:hypothetical protein